MSNFTIIQRYGEGLLIRTTKGYAYKEGERISRSFEDVKSLTEAYKEGEVWGEVVRQDYNAEPMAANSGRETEQKKKTRKKSKRTKNKS